MKRSFVDFETLRRSPRPNTALIAPDGLCQNAETDMASPKFDATPDKVWENLLKLVDGNATLEN